MSTSLVQQQRAPSIGMGATLDPATAVPVLIGLMNQCAVEQPLQKPQNQVVTLQGKQLGKSLGH